MRSLMPVLATVIALFGAISVGAQEPATPPTTVPPFPSEPQYIRATPGVDPNSWYVYASGFTPREQWALVEAFCEELPCAQMSESPVQPVQEEGTMAFYERLPESNADERILALVRPGTNEIRADAPHVRVMGSHPGRGYGYPLGTLTGISAVDEVIAITQANDDDAMRSRMVIKDGATPSGAAVRGLATWQCAPYIKPEESLQDFIDYSSGLVYAVFRVPQNPDLPLRYHGAAYGIVWAPHGPDNLAATPLSGTALVAEDGSIVGLEARCGTTPGFHIRNFTDFILTPYDGPPAPKPPSVGDSLVENEGWESSPLFAVASAMVVVVAAFAVARRRRRCSAS